MADEVNLDNVIREQAVEAQTVSVDGTTVSNRSLDELARASDREKGKEAKTLPGAGLRFQRIVNRYE